MEDRNRFLQTPKQSRKQSTMALAASSLSRLRREAACSIVDIAGEITASKKGPPDVIYARHDVCHLPPDPFQRHPETCRKT
eukprot:7055881-Pyramimonas_sp.AAC.1